ncbi:putative MRP-like protein [Anaplasma centrale str. Israel]|uniref:Iron-sulfur cluster carrier protein n=1 Tax=Anaplasma centrale (strain Israel) TaxID=574556 RepID=D1ATV0_ANACI|nr:Mrp/NBP35 family ATP-binding protein [Anaplasma centrale]ACZ48978.1 putative MRP-like protein [Anaplasma centrale str. Israel]
MFTEQDVRKILEKITDPETGNSVADVGKFSVTLNGSNVGVILDMPERVTKSWEQHFKAKCIREIQNGIAGVSSVTVALVRRGASNVPKVKIKGVSNTVLVVSGKGGVGKSTIATQIALSLVRCGYRVALVDADIYGPSIPHLLGADALAGIDHDGMIMPLKSFGLKSISIGNLVEDKNKAIVWRGPMLTKAIDKLMMGTNWGEIDYMIVDTPPGTGDVHISLAKFATTGAVVVSTPQRLSALQVMKTCNMLANLNIKLLGVVENMSYFFDDVSGCKTYVFGMGGAQDIAKLTGAPFLGDVRIDPEICKTSESRNPTVSSKDLLNAYDNITRNMLTSVGESVAT